MRRVKNRNVLRRIARKTILASGKKNAVIIVAIMLTSVLFTTLFSVGMSLNKTIQESTMRQVGGKSMFGLKYARTEDYEKLKKDAAVKKISYRRVIGMAVNEELIDSQTEVNYAQDENAKEMFSYPTTGRMPREKDEIAMSSISLEKLRIKPEIGARIPLTLYISGETSEKTFTLCGFWEGDPVAMAQESFVSESYCEEVAPEPEVSYDESHFDATGYLMIDLDFANSFDIEGKGRALLERNGYDPDDVRYGVNWAYNSTNMDTQTMVMGGAILFLILLAGYLIIYNVFYIYILTDIHAYGLLKTVGTTSRQLKKMVRMQALIYAVVGIPGSLLIGTALARVLLPAILDTLEMGSGKPVFSIHPAIYLFSALFSLFTVYLSSIRPCRIASKVSPIEAVSYTEQRQDKKKKRKTQKVTTFRLAFRTISRSRKKVAIVACSLALALLLVNGVYAIVYSFDMDAYLQARIIGDFSVQNKSLRNFGAQVVDDKGANEEDRTFFAQIDGVKSMSEIYLDYTSLTLTESAKQELHQQAGDREFRSKMDEQEYNRTLEENTLLCAIYGVDDFALEYYQAEEGTIDSAKWQEGNYALIHVQQILFKDDENDNLSCYKAGDQIEVEFSDGEKKKYEIMAIAEPPYPMTTQRYSSIMGMITLPGEDVAGHLTGSENLYTIINVEPGKEDVVSQVLKSYVDSTDRLSLVSKKTYKDEFDGVVKMFVTIGGVLAGILAILGILNFANAMITEILNRKRELAIMEAVGMTRKQKIGMLVWEGVLYAIFTFAATVILNAFVLGRLIQGLVGEIWFLNYHFTMMPILICLPVLLLIAVLVPLAAGVKIRVAKGTPMME